MGDNNDVDGNGATGDNDNDNSNGATGDYVDDDGDGVTGDNDNVNGDCMTGYGDDGDDDSATGKDDDVDGWQRRDGQQRQRRRVPIPFLTFAVIAIMIPNVATAGTEQNNIGNYVN